MKQVYLIFFFMAFKTATGWAQCDISTDVVDEFDSIQTVISKPINVGYTIPSNFQTAEGYKMIEEGKILFTYTQSDSINGFFLVLGLAEREFYNFEEGYNVLVKLKDPSKQGGSKLNRQDAVIKAALDSVKEKSPEDDIIGFYTIPDRGNFDKQTNMRIYTLTCVIPIELVFSLTYYRIEKIRVNYKGYKHTIVLSNAQQDAIAKAVKCVGEAAKLFPVKP
jgi:hypothetical protein